MKSTLALIILLVIIVIGIFAFRGITGEEAEAPVDFGSEATLVGEIACLPHEDTSGPQTLECAIGLEVDGVHYGLRNINAAGNEAIQTGNTARVTGTLLEPEEDNIYDIVAVIDVETVTAADADEEDDTDGPSATVPEGWETYSDNPAFEISYPSDWQVGTAVDAPWSGISQAEGETLLLVSAPEEYLPETNFVDARATVGRSTEEAAVETCTSVPENTTPGTEAEAVTVGGIEFTRISSTGAAAGNRYDVASYRALEDGACFAVETRIHYSPIEMFGEETGVTEFDRAEVEETLQGIVETFAFTS